MKTSKSVQSGQCLCGAVRLDITDMTDKIGACHCSSCRNWGGGPFLSIEAGNNVEITGQESLAIYNSSDWAERGFCKRCGTHLFYRIKQNQHYHVLAGLMGDGEDARLDHQLFIDQKPAYYSFTQETDSYTGEQVFAMFAESDS